MQKLSKRPKRIGRPPVFEEFGVRNSGMRTSLRTPDLPTPKVKASSAKIGLYESLANSRDKAFLLLTTHKNDPNVLAYYQKVLQHIEAAQDLLSLKLLTPSELKELSSKK